MRRAAAAVAVAVVGLVPATAHGHAVVQPSEARPADPQVYTVTIPNELGGATTEVRLKMPEGIDFALLETAPPGWKGEIVRKGDAISEIRWSGGRIPDEQYGTFRFLVRNPVQEGEITWPIVQTYANGDVQRWIGPADSDEPAARTTLSESATPTDVLAVGGEKVPEATGEGAKPAAPATAETGDDDEDTDRDGLTLGLAIGALLLAGIALATSLKRRSAAT